jgi:hypothetical protein
MSTIVKHRGFAAFVAIAAVVIVSAVTAGRQVVEIHLRGHYFPEPATVRMTVAVEPHAQNRLLRIEADGDAMYRATEVELSGEADKRLHLVELRNLAAGSYVLRAEVRSSNAVIGQATQELTVTASAGR